VERNEWVGELDAKLGIVVLEGSAKRIVGTMPVEGNRQAHGKLHGGASIAFGETLGSLAANLHAATMGKTAVAVDVNATHHRALAKGLLTGTATAIHLGGRAACHEVVITDQSAHRIATVRVTSLLID
jgi:uncharacterized protein (TIGR00369 family)